MPKFILKRTEQISPDAILLTLQPKRVKDRFEFEAGQYAALSFTVNGRPSPVRCFSIVSSPSNPEEIQFAMRIYGNFTHAIAELPIGTPMHVRGPFGSFTTDTARGRELVFITGGIGITPFISMIRNATQHRHRTPITLFYSVQSQDNIPFYGELLKLEQANPQLCVYFFVTKGPIDTMKTKRVLQGRIASTHLERLTAGEFNQFNYLICGPDNFISGMRQLLTQNRVSLNHILTEEFTPTSRSVSITETSRRSVPFWTFSLTSATMALGVLSIMILDLITNVPKTVSAEGGNTAASQTISPTPATAISPSASTTDTSSTASNANQSSSYTTASTPASNSSYTYSQPTYQTPVTSVS